MAIATLTAKGQVTIPKKVREYLHLQTGDKLDFRIEDDGSLRIYPIARKVSEVFGVFAAKASRVYDTVEMKQLLKQAFKDGKL
jgi:antitoxin PrlF